MINQEYKFIYVHIPKTTGTSINNVFGYKWDEFRNRLGYNDYNSNPEIYNVFKKRKQNRRNTHI